ncbi:MAG: rRNA maturation RNase YbeY [Holosporaceae bacterium]|jgi:probable rRNA maturation factor|nr:rRNA maturation RNase YbeY [Holosporaceae bacterium]
MNLKISVEYGSWNEKEVRFIVAECTEAVFSAIELRRNNLEICFLFTNDEEVRILNKTYRKINEPTNVLSFPAEILPKNDSYCILGSIALAFETIERESLQQKKSIQNHLKHLIIHGLLHLLRYDHIEESEAEQMEALEIAILKKLNIKNPYEENYYDNEN